MTHALQLQQFLPYRLNQLAEKASLGLSRIYASDFGLGIAEWRVLATLAEHTALQARQVAALTNMDKVRVSRAVRRLQEQGLLQRETSSSDQRAADLSLTAAGMTTFGRIAPRVLDWEARLLEPLSEREQRAVLRAITLLEARVDALTSEGESA